MRFATGRTALVGVLLCALLARPATCDEAVPDLVIVAERTEVNVDATGLAWESVSRVLRVNTNAGLRAARVVVPVHPFTSMWVPLPSHALLYSGPRVEVVLLPSTLVLPEYRAWFTPEGRRKLSRYGLEVSVTRNVIEGPPGLDPAWPD